MVKESNADGKVVKDQSPKETQDVKQQKTVDNDTRSLVANTFTVQLSKTKNIKPGDKRKIVKTYCRTLRTKKPKNEKQLAKESIVKNKCSTDEKTVTSAKKPDESEESEKLEKLNSADENMDNVPLEIRLEKGTKNLIKYDEKGESMIYECATCGRTFTNKREFRGHMVIHSTVRDHKCDVCGKAFKRKSELKSHMQLHSGIKRSCDECNFVTTSREALRYHVRRMHLQDFRYKCDVCEKSFMSNSELKDHKNRHLGTKSFICEICGKGYLQKSSLSAHKRIVHGVQTRILVKDHRCEICNKSFLTEYLLKSHVDIHSRKFLCTQCGKEFATNNSMLLHYRMHTGERPFNCTHCSKTFTRSNALTVHELTHSGTRPYVCDLCGKSFTQRTTMMVHRKKHPGDHPPPPPTQLRKRDSTVESKT